MKPAIMIAVIAGAVVAGGAGGFLATQLAAPTSTPAPTPRQIVADQPDAGTDDDLTPVVSKQGNDIYAMNSKIDGLFRRLEAAESKAAEADRLAAKLAEVERMIQTAPPAADGTAAPAPAIDPENPVFREAVSKAIVAHEEAERQRRTEEMTAAQTRRGVETLTERLTLSADQIPKVKAALDDFAIKRRDIMAKGQEAQRNGQEFDWRTEMTNVSKAAADVVRNDLTASQLSTFNELVGERGLSAVTDGRWGGGFGGGPGGGGDNPAPNRPRRGGNNED